MTEIGPPDKNGVRWQYHSRSDRHSKVGCWGVAFDLLRTSSLMQAHAASGKVILGVNHEMRDYGTGRKKDLDLVIARPNGDVPDKGPSFKSLVDQYKIVLTVEEQKQLDKLPDLPVAPVGAVLVALEAKACMTAHVKSLPRLYDELNSSHLCVHGASVQALAIAYVQVNHADTFVSPIINSKDIARGLDPEISLHKQPSDTQRVLDKVAEIPRRSNNKGTGFDAIGITVLDLVNDGSPVALLEDAPAPKKGDHFHYGSMIVRMANEYDATFAHI
ncbi:hypothetical protein RB608_02030 [Nocardioides sp. LHD-245]|uniref:hypothetical protein n=1 Tax=Nocardioides sp. LHD-245 TaxID=3051387 RepID=UPI0027E1B9FE|nr:hypothetical protein [Nocardioides sp. LHD-245]